MCCRFCFRILWLWHTLLYLSIRKCSLCYISNSIASCSNNVRSSLAVCVFVLWHRTSFWCSSKRCRSSKLAKVSQWYKRDSRCVGYPPRPLIPNAKVTADKPTVKKKNPESTKKKYISTLSGREFSSRWILTRRKVYTGNRSFVLFLFFFDWGHALRLCSAFAWIIASPCFSLRHLYKQNIIVQFSLRN